MLYRRPGARRAGQARSTPNCQFASPLVTTANNSGKVIFPQTAIFILRRPAFGGSHAADAPLVARRAIMFPPRLTMFPLAAAPRNCPKVSRPVHSCPPLAGRDTFSAFPPQPAPPKPRAHNVPPQNRAQMMCHPQTARSRRAIPDPRAANRADPDLHPTARPAPSRRARVRRRRARPMTHPSRASRHPAC